MVSKHDQTSLTRCINSVLEWNKNDSLYTQPLW
jgi:hypothetical protein